YKDRSVVSLKASTSVSRKPNPKQQQLKMKAIVSRGSPDPALRLGYLLVLIDSILCILPSHQLALFLLATVVAMASAQLIYSTAGIPIANSWYSSPVVSSWGS